MSERLNFPESSESLIVEKSLINFSKDPVSFLKEGKKKVDAVGMDSLPFVIQDFFQLSDDLKKKGIPVIDEDSPLSVYMREGLSDTEGYKSLFTILKLIGFTYEEVRNFFDFKDDMDAIDLDFKVEDKMEVNILLKLLQETYE